MCVAQILVKDINPGSSDSQPFEINEAGEQRVLFEADNGVTTGHRPWITDGTEEGTRLLDDVTGGVDLRDVVAYQGAIYLASFPNYALWKIDSTETSILQVFDEHPTDLLVFRNKLYFATGELLWQFDGTDDPAIFKNLTEDLPSFEGLRLMAYFTVNEDMFFISARRAGVWASDGTKAGTTLLTDEVDLRSVRTAVLGNRLLFRTTELDVWSTDGTPSGTNPVFVASEDSLQLDVRRINIFDVDLNGKAVFSISDRISTYLYTTDGTRAGTQPLNFTYPEDFVYEDLDNVTALYDDIPGFGLLASLPFDARQGFASGDSYVFIVDGTGAAWLGASLWRTDGTEANTKMFYKFAQGGILDRIVSPDGKSMMLRNTFDGAIWTTDGTEDGTYVFVNSTREAYDQQSPTVALLNETVIVFASATEEVGIELFSSTIPVPTMSPPQEDAGKSSSPSRSLFWWVFLFIISVF